MASKEMLGLTCANQGNFYKPNSMFHKDSQTQIKKTYKIP